MDPVSASRADGLTIEGVETDRGPGFHIENPNAPSPIEQLTVHELKARLDADEPFVFLDARTPEEREKARIDGTRLLDEATVREIEAMDRDTVLVFHCHHGGRGQGAAKHFAALGFKNVYNVVGGIDAWSREIDSLVPRY
jgi:monothiol glutaredoxin